MVRCIMAALAILAASAHSAAKAKDLEDYLCFFQANVKQYPWFPVHSSRVGRKTPFGFQPASSRPVVVPDWAAVVYPDPKPYKETVEDPPVQEQEDPPVQVPNPHVQVP